jgi:hypothetical protein
MSKFRLWFWVCVVVIGAVVYRGPKVIKWAANSSSVTIPIGQDLELTIEMP